MNRSGAPLGYRVIAALVLLCHRICGWRIDAEGLEHVPDGGAVMTWNHTGHLDVVATAVPVHRWTGRWPRFLALRDLWDRPVLGRVLRLVDCIPVERASDAGGAFRHAVDALEDGHLVMVAPEGTISRSFDLLPFRTGAARMAQRGGAPLVPTASWGSHRVVTTGRGISWRRAWRLPVTVRVGEPIHVGPDDDPTAVTDLLRHRTQDLLDEARAAHPDGAPTGAWWVPASMGGGAPPPEQ